MPLRIVLWCLPLRRSVSLYKIMLKQISIVLIIIVVVGCATYQQEKSVDVVHSGNEIIHLFKTFCLDLYPKNDERIQVMLALVGAKRIEWEDRIKHVSKVSDEYLISGLTTYSLVFDKVNLCRVYSDTIDPESVTKALSELREELKKDGMKESLEEVNAKVFRNGKYIHTKNEHYRYELEGKYVMRIDYSFDTKSPYWLSISSVTDLRSKNYNNQL